VKFVFGRLLKYSVFTLCLSLLSDGVCPLKLKGLLTYLLTYLTIRLRNDLYCVEWGVKLYSLTHLLNT